MTTLLTVSKGIALVGAGSISSFQGITTYVVDAFTLYAASGTASLDSMSLRVVLDLSTSCSVGGCNVLAFARWICVSTFRSCDV